MTITKRRTLVATAVAMAATTLILTGCAKGAGVSGAADGELVMWTHNAGNTAELAAVQSIVDDFNASQSTYTVTVQAFPQNSYNPSVTAAAASKQLPCILDVDGPNVPNWVWAGYLAPLTGFDAQLAGFLPSAVGTYEGTTYTYGFYDVALTMISTKSTLDAADIRIPTIDRPWSKAEFDHALARIAASGEFDHAADFATSSTGEWWPYAYSPLLQSFGGDLIDRDGYTSANGVLNGADAIAWATWFRGLVTHGYIAAKSGADPVLDFINGKTGILYGGSWAADAMREKFGDDVVFLPPVDFGNGAKIGGGSWQWGVSKTCSDQAGAMAYLRFATADKYLAEVASASDNIPVTDAAAALVPGYGPGGDKAIFREYAKAFAAVRPITPGYPFIASTFTKAAQDILAGADPKAALDQAVRDIDANQKANNNFS